MNRFISTLGLSTVFFAAMSAQVQAKDIEVTIAVGLYNSYIKQTYSCDDSSGSTTSGTVTVGTGFSAKSAASEINEYESCKLVNTKIRVEEKK